MNIPTFNSQWTSMQRRHLQEEHDLFVQYGVLSASATLPITGARAGGKGTLDAGTLTGAKVTRRRRVRRARAGTAGRNVIGG